MAGKKEKPSLFEKKEFHGVEYAQKEYDKECIIFKVRLICAGLSLLPTIAFLLSSSIGDSAVVDTIFTALGFIGWIATIVANPLITVKTIFKFGKVGHWIIPFIFFDLIGFILGLALGVMVFIGAPVIFCLIGVWQSYLNKKDARLYMELFYGDEPENEDE